MSFIGSPEVMAGRVVTVDLIANLPTGEPAGAERYVLENSSLYTSDGSSWTQVAGGGGGGSGTVTSVATGTGLTGGPITTTGTVALANTAVTPASYGSSSQVATFTVDQQGRLTAAANASIAISGSAVSGDITGNAANVTGTVAVAHGGTNSTTSLNNNRVMKSSGGAVIEAAAITAARSLVSDANGIPVAASTTTTEIGYVSGVTSALQTQMDGKQPLDSTLTSLAAFNTNGLLTQTAADTFAGRTLTGGGGVTVTNGNGVSGNPTLSVSNLQTIWLPAAAMRPSSVSGVSSLALVASGSNQPDISTLNFIKASTTYAQFSVGMPKSWNNGTVTALFRWSHAATTTNFGVRWAIQAVAVSDTDAIGAAYGTAQGVTDTGGTTDTLYISPVTSAVTIAGSPATGDTVYFRVYRDTADGADTLAVDARLSGVSLFYTVNTLDDT